MFGFVLMSFKGSHRYGFLGSAPKSNNLSICIFTSQTNHYDKISVELWNIGHFGNGCLY